MKLSNLPIYRRIYIVFILLIIPVYMISIVFMINGKNYLIKNTELTINNQIDLIQNVINFKLNYIVTQQFNIINNEIVQDINFLSETISSYDEVKMIHAVEQILFSVKQSSELIENVGVYLKDADITISFLEGFTRGDSEGYKVFKNFIKNKEGIVHRLGDKIYLILTFPQRSIQKNIDSISFVVYIELSLTHIEEISKNFLISEDSKILFAFSNNIITNTGDDLKESINNTLYNDTTIENNINIGNDIYQISIYNTYLPEIKMISLINKNKISNPLIYYYILIIIFVIISIFIFLLFTSFLNKIIHQPLKKFVNAFQKVEHDNFDVILKEKGYGEFAYLYESFGNIVIRLKKSAEALYNNKTLLKEAEYKHLQSQINPHFLYNSFFIISKLCREEDIQRAGELTQKLGSYFKFITRDSESEIELKNEVLHIKNYTYIQDIRFGKRIKTYIHPLPESISGLKVPRIILQPIFENAYEYAFNNMLEGCFIELDFKISEDCIVINIRDNGEGILHISELQKQLDIIGNGYEKTALININERLKFKFNKNSGVYISNNKNRGLKVSLKIFINSANM